MCRRLLGADIACYRDRVKRRYFRGDAAFANPEIYESCKLKALVT